MTPDEEWAELVAPYDAAASALGYRLLNTSRYVSDEYPTLTMFNETLFDGEATFLDFAATIVRGAPPPGVVTGFNHVQFLTRVLHDEPSWVLTNGKPPGYPEVQSPVFFGWLESLLPEGLEPLRMRGAEDLPLVLERHRQTLASRRIDVPDPKQPLEWRWAIMQREEDEA